MIFQNSRFVEEMPLTFPVSRAEDVTMSEDPTKVMLETILRRIEEISEKTELRFAAIEKRLDIIEAQLVQMDARNDRLESIILALRADFKEFRSQFKEPV